MKRFRITYVETYEAETLTGALLRALNCAPRKFALDSVVRDGPASIWVCDPRHYYTKHPNHYETEIVDMAPVDLGSFQLCVRGRS